MSVVKENLERLAKYRPKYNPILGIGSTIPRFPLKVQDGTTMYLPETMRKEPSIKAILKYDSVSEFCRETMGDTMEALAAALQIIGEVRMKHDFEFWAATCAHINTKEGETVKFVLNYPQRIILRELEDMRVSGKPIRFILLKSRQFGGSTEIVLYKAWIQINVKQRWNSAVVAPVENQARHMIGMFENMASLHPEEVFKIELSSYARSNKNKKINGRECVMGIGSYEEPENLRSFTFQMLHMTEVASWLSTVSKTPESFVQAIRSTVPRRANTLIGLESTAKGVGNFFHNEWLAAKDGRSAYRPIFIPWYLIEEYSAPIDDYEEFVKEMTPSDWELWSQGATLEGINWYNSYKADENYDDWRMKEEYPTNDVEAFQTSGQRVFPIQDTAFMRELCSDPLFTGDISGNSLVGEESMQGIRFVNDMRGPFHVWKKPGSEPNIFNRYVIFVDIGGKNPKADFSVIRVMDREPMLKGLPPEFVATWRGHIDHDILAWKSVQIAIWYHNALLAIEENSLEKKSDGSGHFLTVIDQIAEHYDNLYTREVHENVKEGIPQKYGWHTNKKTKPLIVDALIAALRDRTYRETDKRALDEMDSYEIKKDRTLGAVDGSKDDMVITTAGCVWLGLEYMDDVYIYDPRKSLANKRKKSVISEATI